jgi:hypothetical protein
MSLAAHFPHADGANSGEGRPPNRFDARRGESARAETDRDKPQGRHGVQNRKPPFGAKWPSLSRSPSRTKLPISLFPLFTPELRLRECGSRSALPTAGPPHRFLELEPLSGHNGIEMALLAKQTIYFLFVLAVRFLHFLERGL